MSHRIALVRSILPCLTAFCLATQAAAQTTIVIDGVNDFPPTQAVAGADASTWYFASDATHFYFGLSHPEVGAGSSLVSLTLYLDTDPQAGPSAGVGTTTGVVYNTQQPTLPFRGDVHIRRRLDDAIEGVLSWDGSQWLSVSTDLVGVRASSFVEFAISRGDLGSPAAVSVVGSLVFEGSGFEATYAFVPPTTVAGYDPDPVDFLSLMLFEPIPAPMMSFLGTALLVGLCGTMAAFAARAPEG